MDDKNINKKIFDASGKYYKLILQASRRGAQEKNHPHVPT